MKKIVGFTIIEVLIATIILGVLVGSLVGPLGGLFRMTQRNQQLLDNTTVAQQTIEKIVREWQDVNKFDRSCVDSSVDIPTGVTVMVNNLMRADGKKPYSLGRPLNNCTVAPNTGILLKRVKVTAKINKGSPSVIIMDIARPQP